MIVKPKPIDQRVVFIAGQAERAGDPKLVFYAQFRQRDSHKPDEGAGDRAYKFH